MQARTSTALLAYVVSAATITALALGCALPVEADAQSVLFSQPFSTDGGIASSAEYTFAGYDDFMLSGGGTVNQLIWWGVNSADGFTISFLTDQSGLPGTLLVSDNIPGVANQTYAGTFGTGVTIYSYSSTLATPFTALPGTAYILSIVADSGIWGWEGSDVGNGDVVQLEHTPGDYFLTDLNGLAFTLEGTAIPEPDTFFLGFIGIAVFLCRRK